MRITEIESQTEVEKKGALVTLLNMLKSKADTKKTGAKISIENLNRLLQNIGHGISYEELDQLVQSSDAVDNLIADYNQEFVTIKTVDTLDYEGSKSEPGNRDTVKQMAKRATNRRK